MARTINQIQEEILTAKENASELTALQVLTTSEVDLYSATSTSKLSIWRLWVYIIAVCIWTIEKLFDVFKAEVSETVAASRIHTKSWYRELGLNYQHGFPLTGVIYDNTNYTEDQVIASKIVSHASVLKYVINGRGVLRVKTAKELDGELIPLTAEELLGFAAYMNKTGDAGTTIIATSSTHDDYKLELDVYYDATILDNQGRRLDGSNNTPVIMSINTYLKEIDFDGGRYFGTKLTDSLQRVNGVVLPVIKNAWSKYGAYTYETIDVPNVGIINEIRTPDAGFMRLDVLNSVINYIAVDE